MQDEKAVCTGREGCRGGGMRCDACDLVTMHNEAIKRAARAIRDFDDPGEELAVQYAKAALSAFLADVPVSEAMVVYALPLVGKPSFEDAELARSACVKLGVIDANGITSGAELIRDFKAMVAKLAEEIQ